MQAEKNAMRLRTRLPFDGKIAFFASPLGRSRHTALIIAKDLGIPTQAIVFDPRLIECSFGSWEGLTTPEIKSRYPDEWRARSQDKWNVPAPSGESYADVYRRVSAWRGEVSFAATNLVVCHGLTSRVLRGIYSGLSHHQVFELDEPQDGFFELRHSKEMLVK